MKRKTLLVMGACLIIGIAVGVAAGWKFSLAYHSEDHVASKHDDRQKVAGEDNLAALGQHEGESTVQLTEEEMKEFGIVVGKAGKGKLHINVVVPGEIVPNADELAHIVPRVAGIVREVKKRLGDSVRKDEVMAIIESRELADAQAGYLAGLERLKLAQAKFNREDKLWEQKISSEQDYLDAKQVFAETQIQLRTAEHKLYALGFSEEYLKTLASLPGGSYTRYEIMAPFEGTVTKKHITLGEVVTNESEIYEVADLGSVWANMTIYQKDLAHVQKGQRVLISAEMIKAKATGQIDYVSPIVEEATRTATARVVLENADGLWRPGIFVTSQIHIGEEEVDLAVPRNALQTLDGRDVIFVQTDEGFTPQPVKVGRADREHVEILSGLKTGQAYVTTNAFVIKAELAKSSFGDEHGH